MPVAPTAQALLAETAATLLRWVRLPGSFGVRDGFQDLPFQRTINGLPLAVSPTAQALVGEVSLQPDSPIRS
jgi:hypothetical protein